VAQTFSRQLSATQRSVQAIQQKFGVLQGGDWIGQGANAFFQEMQSDVLPALQRLLRALEASERVTKQISGLLRDAEQDAANTMRDRGNGGGGRGGGAGGEDMFGDVRAAMAGMGGGSGGGGDDMFSGVRDAMNNMGGGNAGGGMGGGAVPVGVPVGGGGEMPEVSPPVSDPFAEMPTNAGGGGGGGGGGAGGGSLGGGGGSAVAGGGNIRPSAVANSLFAGDPARVFTPNNLRGIVGVRFAGAGSAGLRQALMALAKNPTGAELEATLRKIAELRGVPYEQIKSQYDKFLKVQAQAASEAAEKGLPPPPGLETILQSEFIGSEQQLRSGKLVGDAFGLDPVFGALLNPQGGLAIGNAVPSTNSPGAYHAATQDAAGYLSQFHNAGPGLNYTGAGENDAAGLNFWNQTLANVNN
jgi:WXG100 family type VII secretion target